jgi:NTP pyrophosphatase (non-canonical NTP hydrolase)
MGRIKPLDTESWIALNKINEEFIKAEKKHPPFTSAHEGYGVLMEEVEELFEEIRKREENRDYEAMAEEAAHVAAVAMRLIVHVCLTENHGR